jgi:hypothetical protein
MQADEVDAECAELFERVDQVAQAASEPVVTINENDVHAPAPAIGQQAIELRPALFVPEIPLSTYSSAISHPRREQCSRSSRV